MYTIIITYSLLERDEHSYKLCHFRSMNFSWTIQNYITEDGCKKPGIPHPSHGRHYASSEARSLSHTTTLSHCSTHMLIWHEGKHVRRMGACHDQPITIQHVHYHTYQHTMYDITYGTIPWIVPHMAQYTNNTTYGTIPWIIPHMAQYHE